ncbi:protein c-Fos isoform X2 [Rhinichthys klamathensis goyatoka]|uniref:protein c-Fos isoform X2 n=1 Tax=Rhinichthys klamathensis goyatoka TaxID=3034132 RepID=UPI0024B5AC3F|nr:protein c-Fos isoform X2 [Rhinichthys klamathensis goyatoka]
MPKTASVSQVSAEQLLHTSAAEMKDTQTGILKDADAPFVPTVTAVASAPDLKWMVLSTDISSVSPCRHEKPQSSSHSTDAKPARKTFTGRRKGVKDQLTPEEEERKRIRRERNKLAAAKCRNRRQELTNSLQAETDSLEEDKAALQSEIANLLKEKERLELILSAHKPHCKLSEEREAETETEEQTQALDEQTQAPTASPEQVPSSPQQLDPPSTAIFGDSDVLLCSSAELGAAEVEPYIDMRDVSMEDISNVMDSGDDMDLLVPDIDLTSSLGLSEWETLYMSMGGGLEPLSSPACSPTCSSTDAVPVFSFNNAEEEKHDTGKEGKPNAAKEILKTL